jgi:uncharacterized metal-binding protein YceD (DUF177 family)
MKPSPTPNTENAWSVPVAIHDVPESGRHFDLDCDPETRAAIARTTGLQELPRLRAVFDVSRHGGNSLRVTGNVSATVGQLCVLTLEPVANEVSEAVDLIFSPLAGEPAETMDLADASADGFVDDGPEPLVNGTVDLGKIATEFLILGIDPYPRKPGVVFEPVATGEIASPFAALAALKNKSNTETDET